MSMESTLSNVDLANLKKLEESLWLAETRFDRNYMNNIFAPDFFEIGRSGRIHSREDCLSIQSGFIDAVVPMQNFKVRLLATDVAHVIYDSEVSYGSIVEKARRSSIWTKSPEGWQLKFHQGTRFDE